MLSVDSMEIRKHSDGVGYAAGSRGLLLAPQDGDVGRMRNAHARRFFCREGS